MAFKEKPQEVEQGWTRREAPELWEWSKPGQILTGKLLSVATVLVKGKPVTQYVFAPDSKHIVKCLATYDLSQKLTKNEIGMLCRIKYLGDDETVTGGANNTAMKVFDVLVRPDPEASRGAATTGPTGEEMPDFQ